MKEQFRKAFAKLLEFFGCVHGFLFKTYSYYFVAQYPKILYDLTIGTSDKGTPIDSLPEGTNYNHALIVFGGLHGIDAALESDEQIDVEEASLLFDHYINSLPHQGSRTIRTEEAILITMAVLRNKIKANNKPMDFVEQLSIAQSSIYGKKSNNLGHSIENVQDKVPETMVHLNRFD